MNTTTFDPQLNRFQRTSGDAYLKFKLEQQTPAALSMEHAKEVLEVPVQRITPIPSMPSCVLGLLNRRSRVLWVIDLAQMLNLQPLDTNVQQYNVVIVRVGPAPLGLVVREVDGVIRFPADYIQSPFGSFEVTGLTPYLCGCVLQQKDILLVLDAEAIVNSSTLHSS